MLIHLRFSFLLLLFWCLGCQEFTSWNTPKGGDFTLTSTQGVLNTKSLRGKTLFVFFGFLHCPHVCPTTIQELNRVARTLTPRERKRVAFIFVSVDPERDTLPVMKEYFAQKDPSFIAATGTKEEIQKALDLFGGGYKIIRGKDAEEIFIDHTSSVFVINRKGVWVNSLDYDAPKEEIKRALAMASSQPPYWTEEARAGRLKVLGGNEECDLGIEPCLYITPGGSKFEVELSPRPIKHLDRIKMIVRSSDQRLIPKVADLVGIETAMGLIRPKLTKTTDDTWVGGFRLPTCELNSMNWKLRLLLVDKDKENNEIKFRFSSINGRGEPESDNLTRK